MASSIKYWYDELMHVGPRAFDRYLIGVGMGKVEPPKGIEDTEVYIGQHTLIAATIIADSDFRIMSAKEAQGYVAKTLYNQLVRKLELTLIVTEEKDKFRMQTRYSAEVIVLTRKDLDALLQEVADRCAP